MIGAHLHTSLACSLQIVSIALSDVFCWDHCLNNAFKTLGFMICNFFLSLFSSLKLSGSLSWCKLVLMCP